MAITSTAAPRFLPLRLPRVCVTVTGSTAAEMIEKADSFVRDNSFMEFRLDYLKQPSTALPKLKGFTEYHPYAIPIATCRRAASGGKFKGSIASQVDLLVKAAINGCQLVDVELQTAKKLKPNDFEKLKRNAGLILSYHDFRGTKKLDEIFAEMVKYPADYYKIVSTATRLYDNVLMMKFLEKHSHEHSTIGLSMGEQGIISRVLSVRAGSLFTFGAANPGEETAPGQIAARTLRNTYRIDQIDNATKVYGVAGDPVAHSLSPAMMNTAFRRENVNGVYLALHAHTISDLMSCVREIPIHGMSITMPYKQEILKYLDNTDPVTAKIGACNTVVRSQDGKLYGFNTDVAGVIRPLEQRVPLRGAKILVIGAGGAARAAVFGLKERGAEVYVMNRTASAGQKLAKQAKVKFIQKAALKKLTFNVIINATPIGMGNSKDSPLGEKEINAQYVFDMVYNPAETRFMKLARARGAQVISGIEMFIHQGARQFEIWSGKPAPVEEMQRTVLTELQNRAAANGSKKPPMEMWGD